MNRQSWEEMRPWRRRAEHDRPFDEGRYRRGDLSPGEDRARRQAQQPDYYGYESHEQPPRYASPRDADRARQYRQAEYEHDREQHWHRPLYSELGDHDTEGYQYFGGGRQNYAGVESGGGSLAMEHYLPQASSSAFYDWDRSLWGGREPGMGAPEADYSGRGPRDYERSDERIREDVCERLSDDPFVDPSEVTVVVQSGRVTLEGSVEDRPQKYRIEDLVEDSRGVKEVLSRLTVSQRPNEAALGEWSNEKTSKH